jgi:hypothetical protein
MNRRVARIEQIRLTETIITVKPTWEAAAGGPA